MLEVGAPPELLRLVMLVQCLLLEAGGIGSPAAVSMCLVPGVAVEAAVAPCLGEGLEEVSLSWAIDLTTATGPIQPLEQ